MEKDIMLRLSPKGQLEDADAVYTLRAVAKRNGPPDATDAEVTRNVSQILQFARGGAVHASVARFEDGTRVAFVKVIPPSLTWEGMQRNVFRIADNIGITSGLLKGGSI